MPYKTTIGKQFSTGKQRTVAIKKKEKYYSEMDKIRQEAKDKYYSNNSNSAEYDEDVALAKAISLSLNVQNKPEESNIEEPKPVESNIEEPVVE